MSKRPPLVKKFLMLFICQHYVVLLICFKTSHVQIHVNTIVENFLLKTAVKKKTKQYVT